MEIQQFVRFQVFTKCKTKKSRIRLQNQSKCLVTAALLEDGFDLKARTAAVFLLYSYFHTPGRSFIILLLDRLQECPLRGNQVLICLLMSNV